MSNHAGLILGIICKLEYLSDVYYESETDV